VSNRTIGLGAIGCGGFGLFALEHFVQVPGIELVAVADARPEAVRAAAERFGVPGFGTPGELVARPDVELVYLATPPFLHHPHGMLALEAGKHVLCEKPLALTLAEADEMIGAARRGGLLLAANLMQRYNPLFESVRGLVEEEVLGEPLHGYFENYAKDETLPAGHWFWDRARSGGIFVEHGVHFFDLFAGWFGNGRVEAAQKTVRPGTSLEEQVQCTVRYGDTVLVNFFHGFHQPTRLDRQQMRIVFERGDVTLEGWIPTVARVRAIADERNSRRLCELFPSAVTNVVEEYAGGTRQCTGRHRELDVSQMLEMTQGEASDKLQRYGELLRAILQDQAAWIRDRRHRRLVTEENGRASLAVAFEADRMAHQGP